MRDRAVFVIGAGLSGLAAATALAAKGVRVELIEAAGQAGGRCRSYFDSTFGQIIDNGNHLVLSGNRAVFDYLHRIGAEDALAGPDKPEFAFADLASGARWTLSLDEGRLPWWTLSPSRRVPGTAARDYARFARLLWARNNKTVGESVACKGTLWDRLMRPFLLAALNTEPSEASVALAGRVIAESLARGGRACRPRIASPSLAAAFVDPALQFIQAHGGHVRLGQRARAIVLGPAHAVALDLPDATVPLDRRDALILAVPPWTARELVPGLAAPDAFRAIVNAHFQISAPADAPQMLGVIGGAAEWIFTFPGRISVTVSAADAIVERDREELAGLLWKDVARAYRLGAEMPPWQIVKEKRATFAATPAQNARRPPARTLWRNLFLAGDWTNTGLPATIEGAIQSGHRAASLAASFYNRRA